MPESESDGVRDDGGTPGPLPPPYAVRLTVLPPRPCAYLPDRVTTLRAFASKQLDGEIYHDFMDAGFRRSGRMVYQPVCDGCRECVSIRVPVDRFRPDKSQRRCERQNGDLKVSVNPPTATDEKYDLYRRYFTQWHDKPAGQADDDDDRAAFESFLYGSPVGTVEFCYRDGDGKLLAVGIADVCGRSFSSVYFFFDPDHRQRGLGTFGALYEIAWAAAAGVPHYYLGYWVRDCRKMAYKCRFRPYELLHADGQWRAGRVEAGRDFG